MWTRVDPTKFEPTLTKLRHKAHHSQITPEPFPGSFYSTHSVVTSPGFAQGHLIEATTLAKTSDFVLPQPTGASIIPRGLRARGPPIQRAPPWGSHCMHRSLPLTRPFGPAREQRRGAPYLLFFSVFFILIYIIQDFETVPKLKEMRILNKFMEPKNLPEFE